MYRRLRQPRLIVQTTCQYLSQSPSTYRSTTTQMNQTAQFFTVTTKTKTCPKKVAKLSFFLETKKKSLGCELDVWRSLVWFIAARLASRIARKDSLALKLAMRPDRQELIERGILHAQTERERHMQREAVGARLTRWIPSKVVLNVELAFTPFFTHIFRRLSLRPTQEELEERNILKREITFLFP